MSAAKKCGVEGCEAPLYITLRDYDTRGLARRLCLEHYKAPSRHFEHARHAKSFHHPIGS